jgi:hypothetical protein
MIFRQYRMPAPLPPGETTNLSPSINGDSLISHLGLLAAYSFKMFLPQMREPSFSRKQARSPFSVRT